MTKENFSKNPFGKMNAPTMAYKTVYGSLPNPPLRGRTDAPKKMWNGIDVDIHLKDKWLEQLNNLPVEIKSTDEGKDKNRVAFVIFRMPEGKDKYYKQMESNLKKEKDLFVSSNIGTAERPRICVAKDITYNDDGWVEWWSSLPIKIKKAYDEIKI